jgi:ubiquinone/menaquinone biosynthesis C-methylase UbiE
MQDLRLAESSRILKPGGGLLLTVFGKAASEALGAEGRKTLEVQRFVHRRSQKLRGG